MSLYLTFFPLKTKRKHMRARDDYKM